MTSRELLSMTLCLKGKLNRNVQAYADERFVEIEDFISDGVELPADDDDSALIEESNNADFSQENIVDDLNGKFSLNNISELI